MRYGSVCSGIEAATAAWHPLGWEPMFFSEIEPFPCAVLRHHYPDVPNYGDMTKYKEWPDASIDLLVGGTPCQSFSVAGLRKGLDDPRGNLMLTFGAIAKHLQPSWIVWENVPGVLSSGGGRDFGTFLGMLAELGYGFAYRILDAQYFGLAQRRRRVFVVGYLGDWRRAAAVLFEPESLRGDSPPSREKGQRVAGTIKGGSGERGYPDPSDGNGGGLVGPCDISRSLTRRYDSGEDGTGGNNLPLIMAHGQGGAEVLSDGEPSLTCNHEAPIAFYPTNRQPEFGNYTDLSPAVKIGSGGSCGNPPTVAFSSKQQSMMLSNDIANTLASNDYKEPQAVCYENPAQDSRIKEHGDLSPQLNAKAGTGGNNLPLVLAHGQGGAEICSDGSPSLTCNHEAPILAMRESGQGFWVEDSIAGTIDANMGCSGHSNRPATIAAAFIKGDNNGSTQETNAGALLRILRKEIGEEAFAKWVLGILDSLQPKEILRQALHGSVLRPAAFSRSWVVYCSLSRKEGDASWLLQSLRETGCPGCPPQGWEPSEQLTRELGAYLSGLSQPGAQVQRFMRDMWSASEGIGLLRQALSEIQEVGRSAHREGQSAHQLQVRRLTATECEFLQGFPRGYTNIPWRNKPESPDGPRYKALGNSMAVPVMRWIGERIQLIESMEWTV